MNDRKQRIIFKDSSITGFCKATQDTNEVHDPEFMAGIGKRVIVPGMFAFSSAANLAAEFLRNQANRLEVHFNALLSSGDFADLCAFHDPARPSEIRLAAINSRDTLMTRNEYTRMLRTDLPFSHQLVGRLHQLPFSGAQIDEFTALISANDKAVAGFLFSVAYASQALYKSIREAETEIEKEIDQLINGDSKVSPFYHSLEITLPERFVAPIPLIPIDYRIHFEREKLNRAYVALVQCEQQSAVIYRSVYKLVGIPDAVILRMAKDIRPQARNLT